MNFLVFFASVLFGVCRGALSGDEDFARAFDAALLDLVNEGRIAAILRGYNITAPPNFHDCSPSTMYFSFPICKVPASEAAATTVLQRILARRKVTILAPTVSNYPLADYTTEVPSGAAPDIERAIFDVIGRTYLGLAIDVEYVFSHRTDETGDELFPTALNDGTADMTSIMHSIGGFFQFSRRNVEWRTSCSVINDQMVMVIPSTVNVTSFSEFQAYLKNITLPIIGTLGSSETQYVQMLFQNADVRQFESVSAAVQALRAGTIHAISAIKMNSPNTVDALKFTRDVKLLVTATHKQFQGTKFEHTPVTRERSLRDEVGSELLADDLLMISTNLVMPRGAVFRKELTEKVKSISNIGRCYTGNEVFARAYEAAINTMLMQETVADVTSQHGMENVRFTDCMPSYSAYQIEEDFGDVLSTVVSTNTLRIGALEGDFMPVWKGVKGEDGVNVYDGAIYKLEVRIAKVLSNLLGLNRINIEYTLYSEEATLLDGLSNCEFDVTTAMLSKGAWTSGGVVMRHSYRPSCSILTLPIPLVTGENLGIGSIEAIVAYLKKDPDNVFGCVTSSVCSSIIAHVGNMYMERVVLYTNITSCLEAIANGRIGGAALTWTQGLPEEYTEKGLSMVYLDEYLPYSPFYRKDRKKACGDGVIDEEFFEECEIGGIGCSSECTCEAKYLAASPVSMNCVPEASGSSGTTVIVIIVVAVFLIVLALIIMGGTWGLWKKKTRQYTQLSTPLTELGHNSEMARKSNALVEKTSGDESIGIVVTPKDINFRSGAVALELDKDYETKLTIQGTQKTPVTFLLDVPLLPMHKCSLAADISHGEVSNEKPVVVTLKIRMFCTATVDVNLMVVVPERGYVSIPLKVESQLSTRLDPDEITLGKVIGSGAFGTVYKGEWRGAEVAVKSYNETTMADIGLKNDIEREVDLCFKLRMPFIVTFYGRAMSPTKLCIVMEYVPYGNLGKLLSTNPDIPLIFKVRVALDVARAMNFLHKNRVIHRDLKSDNVLIACLDFRGLVIAKLSDFNTSRFWGSDLMMTKTKGVGTPIYMAPEILDGKRYSWKADVYSYAVLLWNMWTQKEPYADISSSMNFFMFVLEGKRLEIPSQIPKTLADLTTSCWLPDPESRPSFQEVVQIVEPFFESMCEQQSQQLYIPG